jgi:hypothetical protein
MTDLTEAFRMLKEWKASLDSEWGQAKPIRVMDRQGWHEMSPEQYAEYLGRQKDAEMDARTARECTMY